MFPYFSRKPNIEPQKSGSPGKKTQKETSTMVPKAPVLKSFHPPFLGAYMFPTKLASSHPLKLLHLVIANRLDGSLSPAGDSSWSGLDICRKTLRLSVNIPPTATTSQQVTHVLTHLHIKMHVRMTWSIKDWTVSLTQSKPPSHDNQVLH